MLEGIVDIEFNCIHGGDKVAVCFCADTTSTKCVFLLRKLGEVVAKGRVDIRPAYGDDALFV